MCVASLLLSTSATQCSLLVRGGFRLHLQEGVYLCSSLKTPKGEQVSSYFFGQSLAAPLVAI